MLDSKRDTSLDEDGETPRLERYRQELEGVGRQLRWAVDSVLAGELPGEALVQGMRSHDPLPGGLPVPLESLGTGGAAGWVGPRRSRGVILFCHGGGGVSGSVYGHRDRMDALGRIAAMSMYAVDYRLAPENPFPADVEDAVCAYLRLLEAGVPPERVTWAGESHGAGLALAAMLRLRDDGHPLPAAAFLASGVYDRKVVIQPGFLEREVRWQVNDPVLDYAPFLRWLCQVYLGGADPASALASPLLADLRGLPPLLLDVGGAEILRGQSESLARAVEAAGGEVLLAIEPGMFHNYHAFELRAAARARRRAAEFLAAYVPD